jgi:cytochrome oxidase Cu insertion factor (SCO1/SenC/PrrC family)
MRMRTLLLVASAAVCLTPAFAADPPDEKTGLKVGEKAPEFTLKDQAGKERKLDEFLKDGTTVAVVFHRSAGW